MKKNVTNKEKENIKIRPRLSYLVLVLGTIYSYIGAMNVDERVLVFSYFGILIGSMLYLIENKAFGINDTEERGGIKYEDSRTD